MTTINDVAERAGVSIMTVSRYFNHPEKLAQTTKQRVGEAVKALQYRPNEAARSLVQGRTRTIAAILSDLTNPFFTTVARGIEDAAHEHGYTLFVGNTDESVEKEHHYLNGLLSRRADGVLLSPAPGENGHVSLLEENDIPVVLIDRKVEGVGADVVRGDSFSGGHKLVEHLIDQGHRDIVFIGGLPGVSSLHDRLSGYRSAMSEAGLDPRAELGRYDRESGEQLTENLLDQKGVPDAIVAANNLVAIGVLIALRRHALKVPNDVALVCFEDIKIAALIDPFLTVVEQPAYDMGQIAMKILLDRIEGYTGPPQDEVLPVELIVRRSSKRAV